MYTCDDRLRPRAPRHFRPSWRWRLRRALKYVAGYKMHHVMNFTDVDDKTIVGAAKSGLPLREYTDQFITAFREDALALGIEPVEDTPRATDDENLKAMADMINALGERGQTKQRPRSFRSRRASYGKLARLDTKAQVPEPGSIRRIRQGRGAIRLWKSTKPGDTTGRGCGPGAPAAHRGSAMASVWANRHEIIPRCRPGVPASRIRDRAKRGPLQGVLALLVSRRAPW